MTKLVITNNLLGYNMFENPKFPIINIWKNLCMNLLLNKNNLFMHSQWIKFVIFSLVFRNSLV
jgi:hypothetical protein